MLKDAWETVNLSEVCRTFQYGTSSKSSEEGDLPVLRMGNIQDGTISWNKLKYSSNKKDISKYRLEPNDVPFNRLKSFLYKKQDLPYLKVHRTARLRCKDDLDWMFNRECPEFCVTDF
jgi:restriction endonuclease S subunit